MALPSKDEALRRIWELAEDEQIEVSRKARTQLGNLGDTTADACDLLFELRVEDCEKLEWGHWDPDIPVLTFRALFQPRDRDADDELFVEVAIRAKTLYLLACKLYGSPQ